MRTSVNFRAVEIASPGTLLNNCSYNLWRERYVVRQQCHGRVNPLAGKAPAEGKLSGVADNGLDRHISEWALQLPMTFTEMVTLFGCTEDARRSNEV